MKDLTSVLLIAGGVVVSPFLVDAMWEFLGDGSIKWMPFFLTMFIAVMVILMPVVRPIGTGLAIGTIIFAVLLAYQPAWLSWLPSSVDPAAPF